ncbi:MAG: hypothetical protein H6975_01235 [Gammaproteobacteria bacterium]|nr:hypothetical protein [Gammaproteobacteria bacterium]
MDWVAVVQQLDRDLLALEMVRSSLSRQETEIQSIPLFHQGTEAPISKSDLKELGAAGMIINQVGIEALVGLTANAIETFSIRLNRHLGIKWEPFKKPLNQIRFAERPRQFRALNNVFKHQEGYIESALSKSANFLVSGSYFADKTYLKHLPAEQIVPNFELALYEMFTHLFEICVQATNLPNALSGKSGSALVEALRERVVYSIIQPSRATNES